MAARTSNLDRLLASLHRRGTLLYIAEWGGIGLAVGALIAVLVTLLLWHDHRPTVWPALLALTGGACVGLIWGIWRRPSKLGAAIRADRQLNTDDLLATAAALTTSTLQPLDPWAAAVLVVAEQRSRDLSASAVVLRRLGPRAWGGIGLSSAIAVTFAMLTGAAMTSQADAAFERTAQRRGRDEPPARPLVVLAPDARLIQPSADRRVDEEDASRTNQSESGSATTQRASTPAAGANPGDAAGGANSREGTGSGMSRTNQPSPTPPVTPPAVTDDKPGDSASPADRTAPPGGGAGGATTDVADNTPAPAGGSQGGSVKGGDAVAPWRSPNWAAEVSGARQKLQSGQVPPAYRDLVRAYFDVK